MPNQKDMKVMQFPSRYVQGWNAIELLPQYVEQMGGTCLIIVTKSQQERIKALMTDGSKVEVFGGECSYEEIGRVKSLAQNLGATVLVAV